MKRVLMIPERGNLKADIELAKQYSLGFEYNDFFHPSVLDDEKMKNDIVEMYQRDYQPDYCTVHGAFLDVIPFSPDLKVREISLQRIEQSIAVGRRMHASAVIFHTNYNPFLNSSTYISEWISQNESIWGGILYKHADMNIYLENMFDTTPDILEALSVRLCCYKNYGVCLDYAHGALSKTEPKEWAKRLAPYIKHVHINDNDLVSDLHLAWGRGRLDRRDFYDAYEQYMHDATVLIETTSYENKKRSLEMLKNEGFLSLS